MKSIQFIIGLVACLQIAGPLSAQDRGNSNTPINPLPTQYFQNRYMGNASYAGLDTIWKIQAIYRKHTNSIPGSPLAISFTADGRVDKRVGVGVNIRREEAGLINRTRIGLTYAYHLPISVERNRSLSFGLSGSARFDYVDVTKTNGDWTDPSIGMYNTRSNYFDADFGMTYRDGDWTVQVALPNMVDYYKKGSREYSNSGSWNVTASYRYVVADKDLVLEPLAGLRGVRGYKNIYDFGAQVGLLNEQLRFSGIYHTSKRFTVGASAALPYKLSLQLFYSNQLSELQSYLGNAYSIGLSWGLK
jgi:type IX secretion system PorP/SprF family membrane protein